MKVRDFIRDQFKRRLDASGCLVIYDDEGRYRECASDLGVESAAELLVSFLSPTEKQAAALDAEASWQTEFRGFCADVLGYTIKSKGQKLATLSSKLWRFMLFSEFVFDLPGELPASLRDVPCAAKTFSTLVLAVCKNLRDSERHHARYMEQADHVAGELKLETAMRWRNGASRQHQLCLTAAASFVSAMVADWVMPASASSSLPAPRHAVVW